MAEKLCKASVYMFDLDKNGNEVIPQRMTVSGQPLSGLNEYEYASIRTPKGISRVVEFGEAYRQLCRWFGSMIECTLRNGECLKFVSKKNCSSRYNRLKPGDVFREVVYDVECHKNETYASDCSYRIKFVYTKA